jgi:hypothetical protein
MFDEPDLYIKGQQQAKYGSRVTINEGPASARRPWADPPFIVAPPSQDPPHGNSIPVANEKGPVILEPSPVSVAGPRVETASEGALANVVNPEGSTVASVTVNPEAAGNRWF